MQQVSTLLHQYGEFEILSQDEALILLSGYIRIDREAKEYRVCKRYHIIIGIPLNSTDLPYVIDDDNQIDQSYPHRYTDGKLCLETDSAIRIHFVSGFDLVTWMADFVETYFFSYEYFQHYGEFPFGERGHGLEGIIQTYSEYFHENDYVKTFRLMESVAFQHYRGHYLCPCGSGKRIRSCHGSYLYSYYTDERLKSIVKDDYSMIKEEVMKFQNEQRNNSKTPK